MISTVAPPWRYGRSMSEVGKKDPIALAVKIAGAVTVVAGAAAAVIALLPEDKPPPPPPQAISGEIFNISTEPDVTLAEYQDVAPVRPKRCEGFEPPPPGALRIALAPRGNGGGPPIASGDGRRRRPADRPSAGRAAARRASEPSPS